MKIEQQIFSPQHGWRGAANGSAGPVAQVVFAFGPRPMLEDASVFRAVQQRYPGSSLIVASTSGEITNNAISDDCIVVTSLACEATRVLCAATTVRTQFESHAAGAELARRLSGPGLRHLLVISDGQLVNGTELARGFGETMPAGATLTGGLAGDGERFETTLVGLNEPPRIGRIVAVAFYGQHLQVGFGSSGGWSPVGASYIATSSTGNILFQLDGHAALDLYKEHLGEKAVALPGSALFFPLCVTPATEPSVVRTILGIDESTRSMVFAGDIPPNSRVQFMQAAQVDLVNGAAKAAEQARLASGAELAFCISCVGRRLVLGASAIQEIASVRNVLGPRPVLAGFYSYGELAPAGYGAECQLHNQTMTITTFREG